MSDMASLRVICEECGVILANQKALDIHHKIRHENVKRWKCAFCDKEFWTVATRRSHTTSRHKKEIKLKPDVNLEPEPKLLSRSLDQADEHKSET